LTPHLENHLVMYSTSIMQSFHVVRRCHAVFRHELL